MNYALNDEKMFADVTDGIAIIINSETGIYYGLNALGTAVYENLVKGASTEDIISALKSLGAPDNVESSLKTFIDEMISKELLITAPSSNASVEINKSAVGEDGFNFTVDEYNDAQELLLADPIHEVKEETGWTPEKTSIGYSKEQTAQREQQVEE